MNDRSGRDLESCDLGLVEVLSQHLSGGTEEGNHEKLQFG
jgi:hypothetical protein